MLSKQGVWMRSACFKPKLKGLVLKWNKFVSQTGPGWPGGAGRKTN